MRIVNCGESEHPRPQRPGRDVHGPATAFWVLLVLGYSKKGSTISLTVHKLFTEMDKHPKIGESARLQAKVINSRGCNRRMEGAVTY